MNPDDCLEELRVLVLAQQHEPPEDERTSHASDTLRRQRVCLPVGRVADPKRMAELVDALDKWLSGGGYPPKVWAQRAGTVRV